MAARMRRRPVTITPFWNRMPRFFLYPLTPPGLYVLLALAVANATVLDLMQAGGGGFIAGLVVSIVAAVFSIKYGYDILERTANGDTLPPRLNREILLDGYELPFKQIAVFIVLGLVAFIMGSILPPALSLVGFIIYGIAVAALFPAIVMTLALERSVGAALNPATLFGIAFRIGWPYFAVLALLLLLNGGAGTVMSLFGQGLPLAARAFLGAFFQNLFFFTMMNLMGYLIFQYHDRVGYAPDSLADQDDGWGELLDPVDEAIEAGDYAAAAQQLRSLIREHPEHAIALRQQRHQVLKLTDDEDALIDNAGTLLSELIDANRLREATEVFIDITDIDPALRPARETDYEPLMNMLVQRGEYRRAVRMANGFHKDFPQSTSIPPLYLEVARIFADFLQQPDRARQVADFLIRRFPDHPASGRAKALRDALTS
ncbi:MAG: hypothetical protein V5A42_02050 [Halofilum sp. (in: g-proteobacteria)]